MGRPPCCDKMGVKKGPWTPEEDIMLVSYVQRHGPANWRQVPTNTGLRRCSKSCRLRRTNYLRPGIRRGNFTHDEETMIIQLQALLGNKWSAIASYLPERTDNDIKNHWNTHLKNKLRKLYDHDHDHDHALSLNSIDGIPSSSTSSSSSASSSHHISKGQWEKRLQTDVHMAKQALNDALSLDKPFIFLDNFPTPQSIPTTSSYVNTSTTYASSTENIAKLLKGFMKKAPITSKASSDSSTCKTNGIDSSQGFETLLGFDQSFGSSFGSDLSQSNMSPKERKPELIGGQLPFTMFENWLLDEAGGDVINQRKTDLTRFAFDQNPDYFHN